MPPEGSPSTRRDPLNIAGLVIAEKYRIEQLVGEGGFAVVYRAEHTIWNKPVAIKFFNGLSSAPVELRDTLQREFIQEGALLTELSSQSAGIVQARDVGACTTPSGQWMPYMVLEWLEGASLEQVLEQDRKQGLPWTLSETVGFLARVLPVLQVAHARGIAHRDIKPANLFVMQSAARSPQTPIKLLDFGVAKMVTEHAQFKAALAKTGVGVSSFTPTYGAPEQFTRSYGATGPWTDVYAMALVAVEMLCGKEALQGDDLVQLGFASANPNLRPTPRGLGVTLSDGVEAVFAKALAVQSSERFANAGEFLEGLLLAATEEDSGVDSTYLGHPSSASLAAGSVRSSSQPSLPSIDAARNSDTPAPRHPSNPTVTATTVKAESAPRKSGKLAPLLAALIIIVSVIAVYSASDVKGAKETRAILLNAAQTIKSTLAKNDETASTTPAGSPSSSVAATSALPATCPENMVTIPQRPVNPAPAEAANRGSPFCMDKREVTRAEYKACVDRQQCERASNQAYWPGIGKQERKAQTSLCNFSKDDQNEAPINCVSWQMADAYCKAQNKRLPSAAEWQLAAYGAVPQNYPWGKEEPSAEHANLCDSSCARWAKQRGLALLPLEHDDGTATLSPVGRFAKGNSPFGLEDVVGNVAEWVNDEAINSASDTPARDTPALDTKGKPKQEVPRSYRGSSFLSSDPKELLPTFHGSLDAKAASATVGFRCAADPR